jgi:hypothetical protein
MQKPNMCVRRGIASGTGVHAVVVLQPNQNWTITMQLEQGCVHRGFFSLRSRESDPRDPAGVRSKGSASTCLPDCFQTGFAPLALTRTIG